MCKKLERLLNENHGSNPSLSELKKQTNELADILQYTEFNKLSERMRKSAQYVHITDVDGKNKISKLISMIRSEPITSHHLQQKSWAQFNKNAPSVIEQYPDHVWLFITLTIPSCDISNLREQYKYLNSSFSNLLKMKEFKKYFGLIDNGEFKIIEKTNNGFKTV